MKVDRRQRGAVASRHPPGRRVRARSASRRDDARPACHPWPRAPRAGRTSGGSTAQAGRWRPGVSAPRRRHRIAAVGGEREEPGSIPGREEHEAEAVGRSGGIGPGDLARGTRRHHRRRSQAPVRAARCHQVRQVARPAGHQRSGRRGHRRARPGQRRTPPAFAGAAARDGAPAQGEPGQARRWDPQARRQDREAVPVRRQRHQGAGVQPQAGRAREAARASRPSTP